MSLRDFYDDGFIYSTFFEREHWIALSPEEKIDLLIDYALPWYFQFLASWQSARKQHVRNIVKRMRLHAAVLAPADERVDSRCVLGQHPAESLSVAAFDCCLDVHINAHSSLPARYRSAPAPATL